MDLAKLGIFVALGVLTLVFIARWILSVPPEPRGFSLETAVGFVTNFFDTLGIGSFATTTSIYKLRGLVPDEKIPGTLNVGHALPTVVQAYIYIALVQVEMTTLISLIAASVVGAWLGAGVVAGWPRRKIQIGMGLCLLGAATIFVLQNLDKLPAGSDTLGLEGWKFWAGLVGNFGLGALMTIGIGLYGPCMILISLLGMNSTTAFPIMMGSCAFLMPVGSMRFIEKGGYSLRPALGLTLGGIPAVLIAALLVKSLDVKTVKWLVVVVVVYTASAMLRSAMTERGATAK